MAKINDNYTKLPGQYLFSKVAAKVRDFKAAQPDRNLLYMGIGDVTLPLPPAVIKALHAATDEMASASTFRGYGPEQGYPFLVDAIIKNEYNTLNVQLENSEVFIGDGAKSDTGNFQELFSASSIVALTDPVYPVYLDTNVMAGRAGALLEGKWSGIKYLPCVAENNFLPKLPEGKVDIIYLCSPNNPTGSAMNRAELTKWVNYARVNNCVILYDAAYRAYISSSDVPHSIYEIEGAKEVAVEFGSFSKTAGFTGLRCSWTVVPKALKIGSASGEPTALNPLWNRRHCTKFNGTAYIIQRAAEAIYTDEGKQQTAAMVSHYMSNARLIRSTLAAQGLPVSGGIDAPYIWFKVPGGDSWAFFDELLEKTGIIGTPGVGFGPSGEGCFRLTAFGSPEDTQEAMQKIVKIF